MLTDERRSALLRFLLRLESEAGGYVFVKNVDAWKAFDRGGDWDIAVRDRLCGSRVLVEELGHPLFVLNWPHVSAFYYEWGQIDLMMQVGWRGITVVDLQRLVEGAKRTDDGLAIARPAHQAIGGWILPALSAGSFKAQHLPVVEQALVADRTEFARVLSESFGARLSERLLAAGETDDPNAAVRLGPALRRALIRQSLFRRPLRTTRGRVRHVSHELSSRLTPSMPVVLADGRPEVGEATRWAVDNRRFVRGIIMERPFSGRVNFSPVDLFVDVAVAPGSESAAGGLGVWWRKRTLRTRGWIEIRASRKPANHGTTVYRQLEEMRSRTVQTCVDRLFAQTSRRRITTLAERKPPIVERESK